MYHFYAFRHPQFAKEFKIFADSKKLHSAPQSSTRQWRFMLSVGLCPLHLPTLIPLSPELIPPVPSSFKLPYISRADGILLVLTWVPVKGLKEAWVHKFAVKLHQASGEPVSTDIFQCLTIRLFSRGSQMVLLTARTSPKIQASSPKDRIPSG